MVEQQLIYADNCSPVYIGIYSQMGLCLCNLLGNQTLKPNCLIKYPTIYIDHTEGIQTSLVKQDCKGKKNMFSV